MPYHQADIRALERPRPDASAGAADEAERRIAQLSALRVWRPDARRSQVGRAASHLARHAETAALGRSGDGGGAFARLQLLRQRRCGDHGAAGFKGRRGSGIAGDRAAYADKSLTPRWDWQKYVYGIACGGACYTTRTPRPRHGSAICRTVRRGRRAHGTGAGQCQPDSAHHHGGHGTSAGNNTYWPEVYLNQSLIDAAHPGPYPIRQSRACSATSSPLDPQLF